jgi:hypothetical protein
MTPNNYTPAEDCAIKARPLPDRLLAESLGRTVQQVVGRRKKLKGRTVRFAYGKLGRPESRYESLGAEEHKKLLREEIEVYEARVRDAELALAHLGRELRHKQVELRGMEGA